MFINFRRIHKCRWVQLLTTSLVLCVVMVCWEPLDHHVVSHVRSYAYRYLVNRFDFINSSFVARRDRGDAGGGTPGYSYLIDHPGKCDRADGGGPDDVLLLLFVKSSPENGAQRRAIRSTWGNETYARRRLDAGVRTLFVLGAHPDPLHRAWVQGELRREDRAYGDLIQQDFADTFHNLTAKLVLQFRWGRRRCPQARFVMSADDDVFVHVANLVRYLRALPADAATGLWVGHVHRGAPPVRRQDSKYYVPRELYPWPSYPDYTAGAGYVVSGDVAGKIYAATLALDASVYIDDVFMGMCASLAGVAPRDHAYFSGEGKAQLHPCIYDRMITSHGHAADMYALWRATVERAEARRTPGPLGDWYCTAARAALLCRPHFVDTYSCMAAFA
ncbi:hypothetical protein NHX12_033977 [Muraenolepis orangiensis]|uniref:Hexosyltransferase n=1 Tax=Muraenolepis orangiensis TaxID=630683 RepID=A0A9Q0IJA2_9TELE|nr:hypothetical protein NHX12_033977 [Muraenolepis orangiensis]